MKYPPSLERLIHELKRLPGVGRVTAERLAFHLLNDRDDHPLRLSEALLAVREHIRFCQTCFNYAEEDTCVICRDLNRERAYLCVVSQPQEILKFESTGEYRGLYHVLGGLISPVNDVAPEDLHIESLLERLRAGEVEEVIFALDPKVEGETTAMFLARKIRPLGIKTSQLAHGIPVGRDLEFADEITLGRALKGRIAL